MFFFVHLYPLTASIVINKITIFFFNFRMVMSLRK